ncbi:MAG: hypothetical protein M1819_004982 [Sarea resinae]|nr:MAG: hypothetical protein M1819_004982 [Sarea resinae]
MGTSISFLDLPRELRDKIYQHISATETRPFYPDSPCVPQPLYPLLLTCRQISQEAATYLYGSVTFQLSAPHRSVFWLRSLGPANATHIRSLVLHASFLSSDIGPQGRAIAAAAWADVLRSVPQLRRLRLAHQSSTQSWNEIIFAPGHDSLAAALASLNQLTHLSYESPAIYDAPTAAQQVDAPSTPPADFFSRLQNLRCLRLFLPPTPTSALTCLSSLPRLTSLSICTTTALAHLSPATILALPPLTRLSWTCRHYLHVSDVQAIGAQVDALAARHGDSLRTLNMDLHLLVRTLDSHPADDSPPIELSLLHRLPRLENVHFFLRPAYPAEHLVMLRSTVTQWQQQQQQQQALAPQPHLVTMTLSFPSPHVDYDDYAQEGTHGLLELIRLFADACTGLDPPRLQGVQLRVIKAIDGHCRRRRRRRLRLEETIHAGHSPMAPPRSSAAAAAAAAETGSTSFWREAAAAFQVAGKAKVSSAVAFEDCVVGSGAEWGGDGLAVEEAEDCFVGF